MITGTNLLNIIHMYSDPIRNKLINRHDRDCMSLPQQYMRCGHDIYYISMPFGIINIYL